MAQLLTFLDAKTDLSKLTGNGLVVKNQSIGPFCVDSNGTLLHPNQILMLSEKTSVIDKGVKDGKLVILKSLSPEKTSQKKEEVPQTVAQSSEKTSVQ